MNIFDIAKEKFNYTVEMRRHFHEYPDTGPEEQVKTMAFISTQLDKMEIPYTRVPGGGIFGYIKGKKEGKTILLRSDIDALPMEETEMNLKQTRVCKSKIPGVMHACGHDGHIAMLLTIAMILREMQNELKGSVILMFEEGEEGHRNIEKLCSYIAKTNMKIDACYSAHVRWDIPVGKVSCCQGTAMAGHYHFALALHGQSGHGSRPDLAHSVIDCFHEIYSNMETLRMRYIRPNTSFTWSIGSLHAGSRFNMIPDELLCEGSIRMMDRKSGEDFYKEFQRMVDVVCPLNYCTYELDVVEKLFPTINNSACRDLYLKSVEKNMGKDVIYKCEPWMATETFSYMCNMYPGIESFVGIKNDEFGSGANHHTTEFDMDEKGLLYGVTAAVGYVLEYFDNPPDTSDFQPVYTSMSELISTFCK